MEVVFVSRLKPLLDAVASRMTLYVPKAVGEHYVLSRYDADSGQEVEYNKIRSCSPVKELVFPFREAVANLSDDFEVKEVEPFAVFGLKECDIRSLAILDKVFAEDEFEDPFYIERRKKMFIISSDCNATGESCFCNLFEGQGFAQSGYDLNVSRIKDGFIVETGSQKGKDFVESNSSLFADVPGGLISERDENRKKIKQELENKNKELKLEGTIKEIVESSEDSEVYDEVARDCVECQACTRVCPTCHCFYIYDTKRKDYFGKMKMWDSCMRYSYAAVAGGANPRKVLGDRMKHRLLHKFVYFLERYGIDMCVGCGRCVDADSGGMDIRAVLKRLSDEFM